MPRAISRWLLAVVGLLLCTAAVWQYAEVRRFQAVENRRLELALRATVPAAPQPDPGPAMPADREGSIAEPAHKAGSLLGRIRIPRLNLSAIVLEGSDERTLRLGVGRVPRTAEPGTPGNVVLGGHRDTFFRPLRGIHQGDEISLTTPQGTYRYTVDWTTVVDPENIEPLKATPEPSLTLVTCYPFHYIGPAPQRFIVRARQESSTSAAAPASALPVPGSTTKSFVESRAMATPLRAKVVIVKRTSGNPRALRTAASHRARRHARHSRR